MKYARGKRAWGECARSGRRMLLADMVADGYYPDLLVDPNWRDERHPQEHLPGLHDPQTLYRPSPEALPSPTSPVLTNSLINSPTRDNVLTWTPSIAPATQVSAYEVWRSANTIPSYPGFMASFVRLATVTVLRDAFTAITNNPYTYTDPFASIHLELGNFYHYYIRVIPVQGPQPRSNILPVDIPPAAVVLSGTWDPTLTTINLSWTASSSIASSIDYYRVMRSLDGAAFVEVAQVDGPASRVYADVGLDRSLHRYDYKIIPVDALTVVGPDSNTKIFLRLVNTMIMVQGDTNVNIVVKSIDNGVSWVRKTTLNNLGNTFRAIAYSPTIGAQGRWVIVGSTGALHYSDDGGETWTLLLNAMPFAASWGSIIWVPEHARFYACSIDTSVNKAGYSDDGITWHASNTSAIAATIPFNDLVYHPGTDRVVALIGSTSTVEVNAALSTDKGVTYSFVNPAFSAWAGDGLRRGLAYMKSSGRIVGGLTEGSSFVAGGHTMRSDNGGTAWTRQDGVLEANGDVVGVIYMDNVQRVIIVCQGNNQGVSPAGRSNDGATFTAIPVAQISDTVLWQGARYDVSLGFAYVFGPNTMRRSADGINWTTITVPTGQWRDLAFGVSEAA